MLKDIQALDFVFSFKSISLIGQNVCKRAHVAQTIQIEKGCCISQYTFMKLDAAKWPRRLRALCGVRCSPPVLHDVKPHLHHAGPTCLKRSPCPPARRRQRSTPANSDSVLRSPYGGRATKITHCAAGVPPDTSFDYGLPSFELCVVRVCRTIISAVSEFVPLSTFRLCLQDCLCLPTCAWQRAVRFNAQVCVRERHTHTITHTMPTVVYGYSLQHHHSRGYTGHEGCFIYNT